MTDRSRAELLAEQVLKQDPDQIKAGLRAQRIVLGIRDDLAGTYLGQIGIVTAANIIYRLGELAPTVDLDVPKTRVHPGVPLLPEGVPLDDALVGLGHRLAGARTARLRRERVASGQRYEHGLFIGEATRPVTHPVTVGADRWLAALRTDGGTEPLTIDRNPLGIVLAASLGCAEVVKRMWLQFRSDSMRIEPVKERLVMSAYDLSVNPMRADNPVLPSSLNLGHACLVGLGATGSGCMFVLGCLPKLTMSLDLVDFDVIEVTNNERLFTGTDPARDTGRQKAEHAREFIQALHRRVTAHAYITRFEGYVDEARDRLGYVLCGLDSVAARRDLQLELPGLIANGGTDGARWVFSHHNSDQADQACLRDLYRSDVAPVNHDQTFADLLGIPIEQFRRLRNQGGIPAPLILAAAPRVRTPQERNALGAMLRGDYEAGAAAVCATMKPHAKLPAGTIAFVALMPAIAMISDLIKRRVYRWNPEPEAPNVHQFNTLLPPDRGRGFCLKASATCECQSKAYREASAERNVRRRRKRTRMFRHRAASVNRKPTTTAPHQPPGHPPVARQRQAGIQPQRPPPQRPGKRMVIHAAAFALGVFGLILYHGSLAGIAWVMAALAQADTGANQLVPPWRMIGTAWNCPMNLAQWTTYTGVTLGVLILHFAGALVARIVVQRAARVRSHGAQPPRNCPLIRCLLYTTDSVGVLLGWVAILGWLTISIRWLRPAIAYFGGYMCVLFPIGVILAAWIAMYAFMVPPVMVIAIHEKITGQVR